MPPTSEYNQPVPEQKPPQPTSDHYQFEVAFKQATSNMYDRIAKSVMHGNYGQNIKAAERMFVPANPYDKENKNAIQEAYGDQKEEVREAYLDLTRYDRLLGYDDPAVSLILLPPKALLESDKRDQFLEDYAGARVVDEAGLIMSAVSKWTLAVVQSDLRGSHNSPSVRPASLSRMRAITPLGYAGMGGSIDRQDALHERHCTELDAIVDGEHVSAYGLYIRGGPQAPGGNKIRIGERDPVAEGNGKAQIIISTELPHIKPSFLGHFRPMPTTERLMYWAGMNS